MRPFKGPPPPPQDWAFPKAEGILSCSLLNFQDPALVGVAAVALGRCPTHSSGQRQSRVCWAGAVATARVPGVCEHKPSVLHTHLPRPTPNPQPTSHHRQKSHTVFSTKHLIFLSGTQLLVWICGEVLVSLAASVFHLWGALRRGLHSRPH